MLREYRWLWSPEHVRRLEQRKLKLLFRCGECRYVFEARDDTGELDCSECPDCPFGIVWNECAREVDLSIEFAESPDAHPDCDGNHPLGYKSEPFDDSELLLARWRPPTYPTLAPTPPRHLFPEPDCQRPDADYRH